MLNIIIKKVMQRQCTTSKNVGIFISHRCLHDLQCRDRRLIWHPFSQEQTADPPIPIHRGKGAFLYTEPPESRPLLDLISSWWVNLHGHGHPHIANALHKQAQCLEHVIFAGFTHQPAVQLCEALDKLLPEKLCRFFFSDNGSTAVEVALKMAFQFWANQQQQDGGGELVNGKSPKPRQHFLCFDGGYHGDTIGAMSVGVGSGYHQPFRPMMFPVLTIPYAQTWQQRPLEEIERAEAEAMDILEGHLREYPEGIAALIIEPLIQGAAGMRMCRPEFVRAIVRRVRAEGVLVIFDEVMTAFGRTGTMFSADQCNLSNEEYPDFLCLSKGITGGFLPLALTVTSERVYQAFLGPTFSKAFAHGHSYTANPLACAAALASLELLMSAETRASIDAIHRAHIEGLDMLKSRFPSTNTNGSPVVQRCRLRGTIAAIDLGNELLGTDEQRRHLKAWMLDKGLLIRPLGSTIYLMPPYCTPIHELTKAYEKIAEYILLIEF